MKPTLRPLITETDYFRARNFLRKIFLLNDRLNTVGTSPASIIGAGI